MLIEYIEHMRKKPHHTRKRFAFLITVCATGIVIAVWSLTLPARLASITIKGSDLVGGAGTEALSDQLQQGRNSIQEVIETGGALSQDLSKESFEGYDIGEVSTSVETTTESPKDEEWNIPEPGADIPSQEVRKTQKVLIATSTRSVGETIR